MGRTKYKYIRLCLIICAIALISVIGIRTLTDNLKYETSRDKKIHSPYGNEYVTLRYDYVSRPYLFYKGSLIFSYRDSGSGFGFNETVPWRVEWESENEVRLYFDAFGEDFYEEYTIRLDISGKSKRKNSVKAVQIRTDTQPIYNHFPTFPNVEKMEWYSESSDGIGLSTKNLYVFAFFNTSDEIDAFLENVFLADEESDIDSAFIPDWVNPESKWKQVIDLPFAFQESVPQTKVLGTEIYINSEYNVLYMHAIWD